jgi:polyisoprenoid-binding protein YceI
MLKLFQKRFLYRKKFSKISADKFHVDGSLSIKGKELPFGFDFIFKENAPKKIGR